MKITAKYVPQSEHDAVLAERDALAEQVAELRSQLIKTGCSDYFCNESDGVCAKCPADS